MSLAKCRQSNTSKKTAFFRTTVFAKNTKFWQYFFFSKVRWTFSMQAPKYTVTHFENTVTACITLASSLDRYCKNTRVHLNWQYFEIPSSIFDQFSKYRHWIKFDQSFCQKMSKKLFSTDSSNIRMNVVTKTRGYIWNDSIFEIPSLVWTIPSLAQAFWASMSQKLFFTMFSR